MEEMIIYHGSKDIIDKPFYHGGKSNNDYGYGFYCTANIELAKEWASVSDNINGYVNKYSIDIEGLNILDLTNKEYSILNWMAILLKHRSFDLTNDISKVGKDYIIDNFYIDVSKYDIVIGYRADDSYFSFARDFINNTISVNQLDKAMKLGNLGKQIVIISETGFSRLKFIEFEKVDVASYFIKRSVRDEKARDEYLKHTRYDKDMKNDLFVIDIIRGGVKDGDSFL